MYDVGEKVVMKESLRQGTVHEVKEGMVQVECEDDSLTWVQINEVAKLLLDEAPKGNFLQD